MNSTQIQDTLRQQLNITDQSLFFLILILLSILLSYQAVTIQQEGLVRTIAGDQDSAAALPPVFPIRLRASALVVGALGFFLCLAMNTLRTADPGDCTAKRSAASNAAASIFVFLAALIRLDDLLFMEHCQPALLNEDDQPD